MRNVESLFRSAPGSTVGEIARRVSVLILPLLVCSLAGCNHNTNEEVVLYEFSWRRVVELEPSDDPATMRLHNAYRLYAKKRFYDAYRCLGALRYAQSDESTEALLLSGIIDTRLGHYQLGEQNIRAAIEADPLRLWPQEALLWHLCERGHYQQAEEYATQLTDKYLAQEEQPNSLHHGQAPTNFAETASSDLPNRINESARKDGWYEIHFSILPTNEDAGIIAVEGILAEDHR